MRVLDWLHPQSRDVQPDRRWPMMLMPEPPRTKRAIQFLPTAYSCNQVFWLVGSGLQPDSASGAGAAETGHLKDQEGGDLQPVQLRLLPRSFRPGASPGAACPTPTPPPPPFPPPPGQGERALTIHPHALCSSGDISRHEMEVNNFCPLVHAVKVHCCAHTNALTIELGNVLLRSLPTCWR